MSDNWVKRCFLETDKQEFIGIDLAGGPDLAVTTKRDIETGKIVSIRHVERVRQSGRTAALKALYDTNEQE